MTTSSSALLDTAAEILLHPGGLDVEALDAGLGHVLTPGVDYADLYIQRSWHESWVLEHGEVKEAS